MRDRAALLDCWEKFFARAGEEGQRRDTKAANQEEPQNSGDKPLQFRKCRFAGQDIYYLAGEFLAPVFCITDHELVMTLTMPSMKAYLVRKDHRSLAAVPGVARTLKEPNPPAALGYCDTPRVFELLYPLVSLVATYGDLAAQQTKFDLDPTFWPLATALRPHLRPDISTLERTPQGLEITCRYCLPSGGVTGPLCAWYDDAGYTSILAHSSAGDSVCVPAPEPVPPTESDPGFCWRCRQSRQSPTVRCRPGSIRHILRLAATAAQRHILRLAATAAQRQPRTAVQRQIPTPRPRRLNPATRLQRCRPRAAAPLRPVPIRWS